MADEIRRQREGVALVALAGAGFGAMAIFAKEAYAAGLNVTTLVLLRFALAAPVLWGLAAHRGEKLPGRRGLAVGLGLGFVFYSVQAGLFFGSLARIDASLAALLLYTYPALVMAGAFALGRERPDRRRAGALVAATGGVALVLAGGSDGLDAVDGLGVVMALGAAATYSGYILASEAVGRAIAPLSLAAAVATGGAVAFMAVGAGTGAVSLAIEPAGWTAIAGLALVSTVLPLAAFLAGVNRIGAPSAAIVSAIEPAVTVALAMLFLGESLAAPQAAGALLVLGAVGLLQLRARAPRTAAA